MKIKFPNLYSEKLAEFVGIMLGDGCIGIYKCKHANKIKIQYQIKVTLDSRNYKYIKFVENLFEELFNLEPKIYYKKTENVADIRCFRKEIVLFVIEKIGLSISPKWNRAEIPIIYMENHLSKCVLRGMFDTDGSVVVTNNNGNLYPRLEIKISPSPMQAQFVTIVKNQGFNYKVQKLDKGKIRIRMTGKNELIRWLEIIGTNNPVHRHKAEKVLNIL